jgi:hypothetical protein
MPLSARTCLFGNPLQRGVRTAANQHAQVGLKAGWLHPSSIYKFVARSVLMLLA